MSCEAFEARICKSKDTTFQEMLGKCKLRPQVGELSADPGAALWAGHAAVGHVSGGGDAHEGEHSARALGGRTGGIDSFDAPARDATSDYMRRMATGTNARQAWSVAGGDEVTVPVTLQEFLIYVLAAFLLTWSQQLRTLDFQDLVMFLQASDDILPLTN